MISQPANFYMNRDTKFPPFSIYMYVLGLTKCTLFICWQELADHTADVSVQHEVLDGMFTFYDSTSSKLHIYQVSIFNHKKCSIQSLSLSHSLKHVLGSVLGLLQMSSEEIPAIYFVVFIFITAG